jgi:hypothetical protein
MYYNVVFMSDFMFMWFKTGKKHGKTMLNYTQHNTWEFDN